MPSRVADACEAMDRAWIWFYTAGMPVADSENRRRELLSDQFEMTVAASEEDWSGGELALQRFTRWAAGMPADLSWRAGRGSSGFSRAALPDLAGACLIILAVAICLPVSILMTLNDDRFALRGESLGFLIFMLVVVGCLGVGGFLLQDTRPRLGAAIAFIACVIMALPLWWTGTAPVIGAGFAAFVLYRAGRRPT